MQRPTCTGLRIRSTRDAHKIFFAIRQGILHLVTRRLDTEERQALRSGCVYAWEERGPNAEVTGLGIERFTEGRRWSPSRVRDEFLFYYEKWAPPALDLGQSGSQLPKEPPTDWDPLVKQTYSVYVETEKGRRKWHLTAYFTQSTVDRLDTVDDIPDVANVDVPDGMFKSTRTTTRIIRNTSRADDGRPSDVLKPASGGGPSNRTFAAYPQPHRASNSAYEAPHPLPYTSDQHTRRYLDDRQPPTHSLPSPYTYQPVRESPYSTHATPRPWEDTPMGLPPGPGYNPWYHPSPSTEGPGRSADNYRSSPNSSRSSLSRIHTGSYFPPPVPSSSSHLVLAPICAPNYPPQDRLPSIQHQSFWPGSLAEGVVTDPRMSPPPRKMSVGSSPSTSTSSRSEGGGRPERDGTTLVPLKSLLRSHPYRRDPVDDKVLRRFDPRASTT